MQCVILAAGEGTRMRPLTYERPKPLIPICGKPLLEHIVAALPASVDELIIVVSYKADMVREHCGSKFLGRSVSYVTQENPKGGTADALWAVKDLITGKFLVMYGDDIHGAKALAEVVGKAHGMLAARSDTPSKFGVLDLNADGTLQAIVEKPEHPPSNFVNIGGFVLTPDIFNFPAPLSAAGEYYLTDSITAYAAKYPVSVVEQEVWIPIGYPEDIEKAEAILCPK
jgi:UDP-N-acetylglucosamine diphosphorylase / glucose-1-phosphate thymidylyltransferase / UDP-N-acetylgalactosamine diphosphorylase / glucosamine-1-phosphate N-acetyltransferase / galactosamine-1-phosphate N-acetyltransferase